VGQGDLADEDLALVLQPCDTREVGHRGRLGEIVLELGESLLVGAAGLVVERWAGLAHPSRRR
jgi:hypothetical protein